MFVNNFIKYQAIIYNFIDNINNPFRNKNNIKILTIGESNFYKFIDENYSIYTNNIISIIN